MKKQICKILLLVLTYILILSLFPVNISTAATTTASPGSRNYITNRFGLILDGNFCGLLTSAEGGNAYAEVTEAIVGPDRKVKKSISAVRYRDITITCTTGMSRTLYDWIRSFIDTSGSNEDLHKSGSIVYYDQNYNEKSRLNFSNALLTSVTFPTLDLSSKDVAKMTMVITPEFTKTVKSSGKLSSSINTVIKKWLPANFSLKINGLEKTTAKVNKISEITISRAVLTESTGESRDYSPDYANAAYPNITITFPETYSDEFYKWFEDFVINDNNSDNREKSGTLKFLSPNLKEVYFTLDFQNLGIISIDEEKSGNMSTGMLKSEMYCEGMTFDYGDSIVIK